jgi:hypothetical protein
MHERDCEAPTAHEWLIVFCKGEPDTRFALSAKKPRSCPSIVLDYRQMSDADSERPITTDLESK